MDNDTKMSIMVVVSLIFIGGLILGAILQGAFVKEKVLTKYCTSKNSTYIEIKDVHYCKKSNQLTKINWIKN